MKWNIDDYGLVDIGMEEYLIYQKPYDAKAEINAPSHGYALRVLLYHCSWHTQKQFHPDFPNMKQRCRFRLILCRHALFHAHIFNNLKVVAVHKKHPKYKNICM